MGYGVSFNLYDAANFGAFQHRERVVLIAKRDGTKCRYLTPTNSDEPKWGLPKWHTFRQAVVDIEDEVQHYTPLREDRLEWLRMVPEGRKKPWAKLTALAAARQASIAELLGISHAPH